MSLADLSKREWFLINLFALMICAALLYQFVVSPELGRYNELRSRFNSQQQRNLRATNLRNSLFEEYQRLREKADSAQKLLFTRNEAEDFLQMLPVLSKKTGNDLTSITPRNSQAIGSEDSEKAGRNERKPSRLDEIAEMPVGITIEGQYGEIIDLFQALEGFKQLMAISEVNLSSTKEGRGEVETKFLLNVIHTKSNIRPVAEKSLPISPAVTQVANPPKPKTEEKEPVRERPSIQPEKPPQLKGSGTDQASSSRQYSGTTRTEPSEIDRKTRYAVQVGAFNVEENSKTLAELLRSKNYEPWVRQHLITGKPPHYVLVGKFETREEADRFGKLLKKELPWVKDYIIKEADLDRDTVLRKTRTDSSPSNE